MAAGAGVKHRAFVRVSVAALLSSLTVTVVARPVVVVAATGPSRFEAGQPCRLADVRNGTGFERVDAQIVRVFVADRCGVPADATAVALTVTADNSMHSDPGFVAVWPEGEPIPNVSNVNYLAGQVRANGVIVPVGVGGAVDLLALNGAPVIVDVTGWFVPAASAIAGRFMPLTPTRAFDSRLQPFWRTLLPGETVTVPLPPGVPADAAAVAITVTTTESPGPNFITVTPGRPHGQPPATPTTSVLNTDAAGQTRAAGTIVGVTPNGLDVYALHGGHVIVDVTGWFTGATATASTVGLFVAAPPRRLADTRNADPIWAGGAIEIPNVAPDAAALAVNVTMITPHRPGYLTAHAARMGVPGTSTVNGIAGHEVAATMAIVPTSQVGVGLFASGGADAAVDLAGWFLGAPPPVPSGAPPANVRPPDCVGTTDPAGLNAYFRSGVGFTGADYQRGFALPDGRYLWLFQDVFVRGRGVSTMVHNAGLIQQGTCFTPLYTGNFAAPRDYLFPDATQRRQHWFWPLGGDMGTDGHFHLLVAEMRENGDRYLTQTEPIATWVVTIELATLRVIDRRLAPNSTAALYGWSVASTANYTYLFAHCHRQFGWSTFPFVSPPVYVHDFGCSDKIKVGRVPRGRFDLAPTYWDGSAWVANAGSAIDISPPNRGVDPMQMYFDGSKWIAVTKIGDWFGDHIAVDVASRPQGPYRTVATIPTPPRCTDCNTYFASLVPYPGTDGSTLIGISNNVFGTRDLRLYDPTFFAIPRV